MKKKDFKLPVALGMIMLLFLSVSCATIPHLQMTYRLQGEGKGLAGKKVFIIAEDMRKDKLTFGKGARKGFEKTSEDIALAIVRGSEPAAKKGIYQPSVLLKEAMESRLKHEGIDIVPEGASPFGIALSLKSFLLDRVERKWLVNMAYEARLMKDGKMIASETVSGEAERYELVGKEQAEVILGEIFTEVVNRLDLNKLFQKSS
ncbi:MAG: hypothetical protein AB1659_06445 [Thermodesulfobacteriota bacterium]